MKQSNNIYKYIIILSSIFCMLTCQGQNYQTICADSDTSVEGDVDDKGVLWSLSTKNIQHIMSLSEEKPYQEIYVTNDLTTCNLEAKNIKIDENICQIALNAGSYGYAECDGKNYSFGCYKEECHQYFPFTFHEEPVAEGESQKNEISEPVVTEVKKAVFYKKVDIKTKTNTTKFGWVNINDLNAIGLKIKDNPENKTVDELIVTSKKVAIYEKMDIKTKTKDNFIQGDSIKPIKIKGNWAYVSYNNTPKFGWTKYQQK